MKFKSSLGDFDLLIVGSGLFGLTVARLAAEKLDKKSLVIDKRGHLGGNAYSYIDEVSGIEVHKYGTHIFHTSNLRIWEFVSRFMTLNNYRHRVLTNSRGRILPIPINLQTLNQVIGKVFTPESAQEYLRSFSSLSANPNTQNEEQSLEDYILSKVGKQLYEALIHGYTWKQWQIHPKQLPSSIIQRLPIRFNYNSDYFDDEKQGVPTGGYFDFLSKIADHPNVNVALGIDYFDFIEDYQNAIPTIYTGPIDKYFSFEFGPLTWRTLDFEIERLNLDNYQGIAVMNFNDSEIPYTRIHEFKHLHTERAYTPGKTIIMKEFSRFADLGDEPYYPVNSTRDVEKLKLYRERAKSIQNVVFGGRLGSYKYLDMHMAIGSAMRVFHDQVWPMLGGQHDCGLHACLQ